MDDQMIKKCKYSKIQIINNREEEDDVCMGNCSGRLCYGNADCKYFEPVKDGDE